MQIIFALGRG